MRRIELTIKFTVGGNSSAGVDGGLKAPLKGPSPCLPASRRASLTAVQFPKQATCMTVLYVDADACPVKDEVYRVADRYTLAVFVVANSWIRTPRHERVKLVVVDEGPDAADDWIADRIGRGDVAITADIPLADRVLKAGGEAVHPTGRPFTPDSIGGALASRAVGEHLRSMGELTGGPRPFLPADRSRFLQALDAAVRRAQRAG